MKKLLVSACLLGVPCRYDGKSKPDGRVLRLQDGYELIPVCPEQLGGLPTPRTPCEIKNGAVQTQDGTDRSAEYHLGAKKALARYQDLGCTGAVLKKNSPSCGKGLIYDGSFQKTLVCGNGVTAQLLLDEGIPVYTEDETENLI